MDRIVVAVDGSPGGRRALAWSVAEAVAHDATLELVTVGVPPYLYGQPLTLADDEQDLTTRMRTLQQGVLEEVAGDGPRPRTERRVEVGDPRRVLRDRADGADLLVVGSRGHGELTGVLLGSVSQYLVTHAPCTVVVVRPPGDAGT